MKIEIEKIKQEKSIKELIEFGIINIDKSSGPTSFDTSDFIRKKLGLRKTSHFGTLDPKVTGVLPVALNRACKLTGFFLGEDKEYVGIMRFHEDVSLEEIKKAIEDKFTGKIIQLPPVKSRVKRQEREREIKYFEIIEKKDTDFLFKVECQGGTYIRKLCLPSNTEILSKEGLVKIKNFYSNPNKIYSFYNNELSSIKPTAVQKIISPKKLIRVITSSGIKITATPDHKILVSTKEGYFMKEFQKLKKEDYLVKIYPFVIPEKKYPIPDLLDDNYYVEQPEIKEMCKNAMIKKYGSIREMSRKTNLDRKAFLNKSNYAISIKHLKISGIYEEIKDKINTFKTQKGRIIKIKNLTSEHFYLLGLIASDGNNTREKKTARYTRIKFHNKEKTLINKFKKIYKKLFPSINISEKKFRENLIELDSSNSLFATIAANLGVVSPEKNSEILPILYCEKKYIRSFLRGYFDGDGTAYFSKKRNKKGTYSSIRIYCTHYHIIKRIHQMLLKFDIKNKIIRIKTNLSLMYCVDINDLRSKKKFIKEIGSSHPKKKAHLNKILQIKENNYEGYSEYLPLHYKKYFQENQNKLKALGGNLNRILKSKTPLTKRIYEKASKILELSECKNVVIEKIRNIHEVNGEGYVYDMTIPKTHNFLIETGYISSNCHDLGQELKKGAHMLELRRIRAGIFKEGDITYPAVNLYDFEKAVEEYENGNEELLRKIIIPGEVVTELFPAVQIKEKSKDKILHGQPIFNENLINKTQTGKFNVNDKITVFCSNKFIGIFKVINQGKIFARPEFVLQPI